MIENVQIICDPNANNFTHAVFMYLQSLQGRDYKLHYTTSYHPNGSITFSALIEVFASK